MPASRDTIRASAIKVIMPYWRSDCGRATVYVGDCRDVLSGMMKEQFHAVVTDPPYGLEFMGNEWDAPWKKCGHNGRSPYYQEWFQQRAEEILRVAKPGAHLLSFGGTRMWHRMACAVEDAGWDVRDTIMWVYGSGFPKSMDVSKAIDKMIGAKRRKVTKEEYALTKGKFGANVSDIGRDMSDTLYKLGMRGNIVSNKPATDTAREWDGWGTSLKPSYEPILLARKPLPGSVAACVLEHGCGGINVDGCRVGNGESRQSMTGGMARKNAPVYGQFARTQVESIETTNGRWPSNLIHDGSDEAIRDLPDGAARYFYSTKADNSSDRPHGKGTTSHPTVKPLDLMRYLVRLVCVRGGTVLDPFTGSGSTGVAALVEGMNFVGIEQSQEYADIAVGRLRLALESSTAGILSTRVGGAPRPDTPPTPERLRGT
jgi:DNA modification methylase